VTSHSVSFAEAAFVTIPTCAKVERRVERLRKRREDSAPLWASGGDELLTQVAGELPGVSEVEADVFCMGARFMLRLAASRLRGLRRVQMVRERLMGYLTPDQVRHIEEYIDRVYPARSREPYYALQHYQHLCEELVMQ
jgi:hypothetical protein